jgi:hypothetical protein
VSGEGEERGETDISLFVIMDIYEYLPCHLSFFEVNDIAGSPSSRPVDALHQCP